MWPEARRVRLMQAAPGAPSFSPSVTSGAFSCLSASRMPVGRRRRAPGDHGIDEHEIAGLDDHCADDDAHQCRAQRSAAKPGPGNDDRESENHPNDEFWKRHTQQPINRPGLYQTIAPPERRPLSCGLVKVPAIGRLLPAFQPVATLTGIICNSIKASSRRQGQPHIFLIELA